MATRSNAFNPTDTAVIMVALSKHLDRHMTDGNEWPADAEFAVVYSYSTWPMGWDTESHVRFFSNREELDIWVKVQHEWTRYEDNHVAYQAYQWDLGPNLMDDVSWSTGNL